MYDAQRYARVARARSDEAAAMRAYPGSTGCRLEYLRRQLDDPYAEPCGRCDSCAGSHQDRGWRGRSHPLMASFRSVVATAGGSGAACRR